MPHTSESSEKDLLDTRQNFSVQYIPFALRIIYCHGGESDLQGWGKKSVQVSDENYISKVTICSMTKTYNFPNPNSTYYGTILAVLVIIVAYKDWYNNSNILNTKRKSLCAVLLQPYFRNVSLNLVLEWETTRKLLDVVEARKT